MKGFYGKKIIKFKGKSFDINSFKAGVRSNQTNDKNISSIFDKVDSENKYGPKNGVLDENELSLFLSDLCDIAGNKTLSKKEAERFLQKYNLNDLKQEDLLAFLNFLESNSEKIESATNDSLRSDAIKIRYKEGYEKVILTDGSEYITAVEKKDNSLHHNVETNIPFNYMGDNLIRGNTIQNSINNVNMINIDNILKSPNTPI